MNPEPEPEVKFIPPENKPSVAVGVFNGLGLFFIVLPLGLLAGVIALVVLMATLSMLMPWLWLFAFIALCIWKWRQGVRLFRLAFKFARESTPVALATSRQLAVWPFCKVTNGSRRFVNYLKTGYPTLD
jgi:hypothetical protein